MFSPRALRASVAGVLVALLVVPGLPCTASAQEPPPEPGAGTQTAQASPTDPASGPTRPEADPQRKTDLVPAPVTPPPAKNTFDIDPLADGAVIGISLSFAGILDQVNSTGEIRPQQISPTFDRSKLIWIDRGAVNQTVDKNAGTYSNIGLFIAGAFAVVDPVLSGFREHSVQAALADGFIYAESFSLTFALTNMVKLAVRRPRPVAYMEAAQHKDDPSYSNADTDSALSFFSGHSSTVASIGATATYLAFARSPHTARPWITLLLSTALTAGVSVERVRYGAHFPTDVIAGSIAGAGIGLLVPHLHRSDDIKQRRVWVGFQPAERMQGGTAMLSGIF